MNLLLSTPSEPRLLEPNGHSEIPSHHLLPAAPLQRLLHHAAHAGGAERCRQRGELLLLLLVLLLLLLLLLL
jgi:hypothetical protein